jgi:hypothetical protein
MWFLSYSIRPNGHRVAFIKFLGDFTRVKGKPLGD